jgi:hypothetical protein
MEEKQVFPDPIYFSFGKEDTPYGEFCVVEMDFLGCEIKTFARSDEKALVFALEELAKRIRNKSK